MLGGLTIICGPPYKTFLTAGDYSVSSLLQPIAATIATAVALPNATIEIVYIIIVCDGVITIS